MKTTKRTLSAAFLAALFALASCDKSDIAESGIQQPTGVSRVIAVSFQNNSTKTILDTDGLTPKFEANDQIMVANGEDEPQVRPVSVDGTITTTLSGDLIAVYPATAAKMNGNAIEGVLVPTEQDGTFASANICKAEIADGATEATFVNQTAVFKITPGAGADTKYVEVITSGAEIANYDSEGKYPSLHKIHVASTSADPVYVSILLPSDLKISNLGFADGFNIKGLKDDATEISVNTLYTVTSENWNRPYVEIGGLKWATMNVGATTVAGNPSTCYGDFFAWGETETHYESVDWNKPDDEKFTWKTGKEDGYNWANYNHCNGTNKTLTKYCDIASYGNNGYTDTKTVLDPEDDAATANWGSSWRMPTSAEFKSLYDACDGTDMPKSLSSSSPDAGVYWLPSDQAYLSEYTGIAGALFVDKEDTSKRVFFPAAGSIALTNYTDVGSVGYYWSSSLGTNDPTNAYSLYFYQWIFDPLNYYYVWRYHGKSIRPLSE